MNDFGYIDKACDRLHEIAETQRVNIEQGAALVAQAIQDDRLIHVFGAGGHTSLIMGEMFFRVGGLANINPLLEPSLTAFSPARKFIQLERCPELGRMVVRYYDLQQGDVLLLFHTIGVNASCIDAALEAKERGVKLIGIASGFWQEETPPKSMIRHASGKNLKDIADVWIDDRNTIDDAVVEIPGIAYPVGPLSGIGTFAIGHLLEIEAMRQCLAAGVIPPVWQNANTPEGEKANSTLLSRYGKRIKLL